MDSMTPWMFRKANSMLESHMARDYSQDITLIGGKAQLQKVSSVILFLFIIFVVE